MTITDTIPIGFSYVTSSPLGSLNGQVMTWNIGNAATGSSATVSLTVQAGNPYTGANPATNAAALFYASPPRITDTAHVGVANTASTTVCFVPSSGSDTSDNTFAVANVQVDDAIRD